MTTAEFYDLTNRGLVILDGATGSNLQTAGMPTGVCPEQWILENPKALLDLQKAYVEAGTDILYAPTFSGNRIKLEEFGLADRLSEINCSLVALSREAAMGKALVAGDLTMTGRQLEPVGDMVFEELIEIYKEQIICLEKGGVDLLVVETMMDMQECRAALIAAKEVTKLPVMVTLTFREDGRTLFGTPPEVAAVVLENLGAAAVGANCSTGPDKLLPIIEKMSAYTSIPVIAKPNAGLPVLDENGQTVYDMNVETFADHMVQVAAAGAGIIGGCCGSTPEYIRRMKEKTADFVRPAEKINKRRIVTSSRKAVEFLFDEPLRIIGERINPTGKKKMQSELKKGCFDYVCDLAKEQEETGADLLDINVGMNGIDEKETFLALLEELAGCTSIPLCLDSSHVDVLEAALRIYPGRALVNSVSLESEKIEKLLPVVKKYGAMFVLLPVSDQGVPETTGARKEIIRTVIERAEAIGLSKDDIIVDGLVNTIGASKQAGIDTLETIRYVRHELGMCAMLGLANISFGLPGRSRVNSTFLAMAVYAGAAAAIADPADEQLMLTLKAGELLLNKNGSDSAYIKKAAAKEEPVRTKAGSPDEPERPLYQDILDGNRKEIVSHIQAEMAQSRTASELLNEEMIPGITEVGNLYDRQVYFLPQLISSAEAMKTGVDYLEPHLKKAAGDEELPGIVIATVQGDIHDIGKNLVALMLKNHGFRVYDLGKDVAVEEIVETAIAKNASVIALSALMTTTMREMPKVIRHAKDRSCEAKVIIGGAVITQDYADEIGADGYSGDATEAVKLVKKILSLH